MCANYSSHIDLIFLKDETFSDVKETLVDFYDYLMDSLKLGLSDIHRRGKGLWRLGIGTLENASRNGLFKMFFKALWSKLDFFNTVVH